MKQLLIIIFLVWWGIAVTKAVCIADFEGSSVDAGNLTSVSNLNAGTTGGTWSDLATTNGNIIVADTMIQFGFPNQCLYIGNDHINDTTHISTATLNLDSPLAIGSLELSMMAVMEGFGGQSGGMYIEGYSGSGQKLFKVAFGNGENAASPAWRGEIAHYDDSDARTDLGGDVWTSGDWTAGQGTKAEISLTLGTSDYQIDADNGTSIFSFSGLSYVDSTGGDLAKITFTAVQSKASWALDDIAVELILRKLAISGTDMQVIEGQSGSYEAALQWSAGYAPTADVQVLATPVFNGQFLSLNGQPAGQAVTLTFTAAGGYDTPQAITVSAIDDTMYNGERNAVIQHTIVSTDSGWDGISGDSETVKIYDDESPMGAYDLWYDAPATEWETQALPIGNGRLGGMIFGGVSQERIQFNEDSVWSGDSTSGGTGRYEALGDLYVNLNGHTNPTNYKRNLDIGEAMHIVTYNAGGIAYTRECFASNSAQVMVMRFTADQAGAYTGSVVLDDAHGGNSTATGNKITFGGTLSNGLIYETQVLVLNNGGAVSISEGSNISFQNCDSLTLLLAAETDYLADYTAGWRGAHPAAALDSQLTAASEQSYAALRSEHIAEYKEMFDRCVLDVGEGPSAWQFTPTNIRLANYKSGAADPGLENLVFQYGRYLLISSSRPGNGALPANLQGLWNDSLTPRWRSDYHSNINIEMNYWLAEPTNLSECHQVLIDYFTSLRDIRKLRTVEQYGVGTRGWTVQTENNIYGGSSWKWNPPGSAWYCQHAWEHYAFTQDQTYLINQAYPMLKEVAEFWHDRLVVNSATGKLVSLDSWSPEQGPAGTAETDIASYDQEIVWDLFTNYIQASEVLGVDGDFRSTIQSKRDQLLWPGVGSWGQLMEWTPENTLDNPTNTHRHVSHLFGLHPGRQITPLNNPALTDAARVSLNARGDGGTGWSKAWKINFWARLLDGDRAHVLLGEHLKNNFYANLFDTHPPFQIDGNFGYTAGVAEMLLQSHADQIHFLPALPAVWPDGSAIGLCARGGLEVDMEWANGQLTLATIRPKKDGVYKLRYANVEVVLVAKAEEVYYWNGQWKNDINLDGEINLIDFSIMTSEWLSTDCDEESNWCLGKDVNHDNQVNIEDIVSIFERWLYMIILN